MTRTLTALPIYNEANTVNAVLDEVLKYSDDVLVVDDGSSDGTSELLKQRDDIQMAAHSENKGYGAALFTSFDYAAENGYDILVTMDCDGQHQPGLIPDFVTACEADGVDLVSGSRYLKKFEGDSQPPEQRLKINRKITGLLNERLGFDLTDAFCGFKAYRVETLAKMKLTEPGYAMPLELWVQTACLKLNVVEHPIPLIYLDEKRSFGGSLDDGEQRLRYYVEVINRSLKALPNNCGQLAKIELTV